MLTWRMALAVTALLAGAPNARAQDDGTVCARAETVQVEALPDVIKACGRIVRGQKTGAGEARVLRYRGIALVRWGEPQEAIPDLDRALQLVPEDKKALKARAEAHQALDHRAEAIADYSRLAQLEPGTARWRKTVADLGGSPPPAATPVPDLNWPPWDETEGAASSPAPAPLAPAARDELITALQTGLRELGYSVAVSGRLDDRSREAIDRFATDTGVSTPTTPNEQLLASVQAEVSARRDRRREEQRALNLRAQSSLADLGYDIGAIDGAIGPRSRRALSAWLRTVGRPDTSTVDEALVASLETAVAEKLDAAADREDAPEPADALLVPGDAPPASLAEPPPSPRQPAGSLTTNGPRQPIGTAPIANEPPALSTSKPVPARGCSTPVAKAPEEERLALVIGNSNYRHVTPLGNPRADAEDMAKALCDLGFEIIDGYDLDRTAMDDRTSEFARRAQTADLAFVYYSGHGLQFEGRNYLVPIDGRLEDRHDLRRMVELDLLTEDTSAAKKAILVVDACRNDPTRDGSLTRALGVESRSIAGVGPGLALPNLNPGSRTLVAFAARPGSVAFDSKAGSRNSPYVEALLQRIKTPDVDVEQMLGRVQDDVAKATGNAQQPSFVSMLGGDQVLLVATPPTSSGVALSDMTSGERRAIQNSLKWLGFWPYPVDGQMSPLLEGQLRSVQRVRGDEDTGLLTPAQAVALHRRAAFERPPYPLPFETRDAYLRSLRGDIEAIRQMGMVRDPEFVAATGYRKDPGQAAELYEIAATSGDSLAAGRLGLLLSQPGSSENDLTKARNWLERAAAAGDPQAALRLAEILLDGPDAEAHRDEAAKLLGVARTDADTDGIAVALLRSLGMPIVQ